MGYVHRVYTVYGYIRAASLGDYTQQQLTEREYSELWCTHSRVGQQYTSTQRVYKVHDDTEYAKCVLYRESSYVSYSRE